MLFDDFKTTNIKDNYRFEAILGEGAFGSVIEATKLDDNQRVAIKMVKKEILDAKDSINLMTEIAVLDNLDHPNVVKMVEAYDNEQAYFVVLECMEGGELFDRIIEKECYSENLAANTIRPCVDAMRYCHN